MNYSCNNWTSTGSLVTLCTTTMLDELMIVIAQLVEEDMETSELFRYVNVIYKVLIRSGK